MDKPCDLINNTRFQVGEVVRLCSKRRLYHNIAGVVVSIVIEKDQVYYKIWSPDFKNPNLTFLEKGLHKVSVFQKYRIKIYALLYKLLQKYCKRPV